MVTAPLSAAEMVEVPLTLNSNQSRLEMVLCVQPPIGGTVCDVSSSPLAGSMLVALDWSQPQRLAALRDFRFVATSNFQFMLSFGIFGNITAGATNVEILHADPGPHRPFAVWAGDAVSFLDTPHRLRGAGAYHATTTALCSFLGACDGSVDLTGQSTSPIGQFGGPLHAAGGRLSFTGEFRFDVPVSVNGSPVGTLAGRGNITASAPLRPALRIDAWSDAHRVSWSRVFDDFRLQVSNALGPEAFWQCWPDDLAEGDAVNRWVWFFNEDIPAFYQLASECP